MIAKPREYRATPAISEEHESRCLIFTDGAGPRSLRNPAEISELLKDASTFVWFDLAEPTPDDLAMLKEEFSLHPTAVEDAALVHERPKVETYDDYLLVVLHAASLDADGQLIVHELAVFVGKNFVVTIRAHPVFPLDEIERRWTERSGVAYDPVSLLYVILDVVVDAYHPVTVEYDERLVGIENAVLGERKRTHPRLVLRRVLLFKRDLIALKRAVAPVRDILSTLLRSELTADRSMNAYFRDVADHAARVTDQIDSIRDLLNSTLDIHLSSEAHQQGEIAKQLTVIATIFLPLTYITGFFGQNFGWMVAGIQSPRSFWVIGVGSQVAAAIALVAYFRYKRWT